MTVDSQCRIVILYLFISPVIFAVPIENIPSLYDNLKLYNNSTRQRHPGESSNSILILFDPTTEYLSCGHDSDCDRNEHCSFIEENSGFDCICKSGYTRAFRDCIMMDCSDNPESCHENAFCKHSTVSGKRECQCRPGFYSDGFECVPKTHSGFLLVNQDTKTFKIPFSSTSTKNHTTINEVNGDSGVAGVIDIDCLEEKIYSSASRIGTREFPSKFNITQMSYNGTDLEPFIADSGCPEGIAIDWVSRNIFWTDKTKNRIAVASLITKRKEILIQERTVDLGGIVVHPGRGKIFWADSDPILPRIDSANEDGSEVEIFESQGIRFPTALSIDWDSEELCWADLSIYRISCKGLEGARKITRITSTINYPFLLSIAQGHYYWTEFNSPRVEIRGKNGERFAIYPGGIAEPSGIIAVREQCPKGITNVCRYNNGGCKIDQLCLPRGQKGRTCV